MDGLLSGEDFFFGEASEDLLRDRVLLFAEVNLDLGPPIPAVKSFNLSSRLFWGAFSWESFFSELLEALSLVLSALSEGKGILPGLSMLRSSERPPCRGTLSILVTGGIRLPLFWSDFAGDLEIDLETEEEKSSNCLGGSRDAVCPLSFGFSSP